MKTVTLSYGTVGYLDQGAGKALLMVHGFPLDHSMWRFQLQSLTQSYRLIVPDLAGFGISTRTNSIVSMQRLADELVELLDYLALDRVTFCGLSMGGYIGWQFWKHHRDRLDRIIACNTRAAADLETVARGRRVAAQSVRSDGMEKVAQEMLPKLFSPANLAGRQDVVQQLKQTILATDRESVAQAQEAMALRSDATSWLAEIQLPTLFVAGMHDVITPPEEMQKNADLVPESRFVLIPDAGHLTPLENPTEFNRAVLSFLLSAA